MSEAPAVGSGGTTFKLDWLEQQGEWGASAKASKQGMTSLISPPVHTEKLRSSATT